MKKSINLLLVLIVFSISILFTACGSEEVKNTEETIQASTIVSNTAVLSNSANATRISNSANASRISNSANASRDTSNSSSSKEKIDYDLLGFNQTMLYSQVTNIVNDYQSYLGKRIRIKGNMQVVDGGNGKYYYMVNCGDATACCTSGFEFILKGGSENPSDYPENGKEITVNGVLQEYYEGEQKYIHLVDSTVSSIVKSK